MKVKLITGYCPISGHPRSAQEYGRLGDKFRRITKVPLKAFYSQVGTLWPMRLAWELPFKPTVSEGDNPEKNTLEYHAVNHQKTEWLLRAMLEDENDDIDTFIWIDYGICHLPDVTPELIEEFALRVGRNDFAIPGCWEKPLVNAAFSDRTPCWRFCGSMMVVPRQHVLALDAAVRSTLIRHVQKTHNVPWEVNTWARVETRYPSLPIRWYKADHNASMFTNYEAPNDAAVRTCDQVRD